MFKLITVTAAMLQVATSVSLQHMKDTNTQLQDIETSELAQAQGFKEWLASFRKKKPAASR